MDKDIEKYLKDLYYNLDSPESYSSFAKIFQAAKKNSLILNEILSSYGFKNSLLLPFIGRSDINFREIKQL